VQVLEFAVTDERSYERVCRPSDQATSLAARVRPGNNGKVNQRECVTLSEAAMVICTSAQEPLSAFPAEGWTFARSIRHADLGRHLQRRCHRGATVQSL
jgi:hypothetical protein